jgi:hypothetical protein
MTAARRLTAILAADIVGYSRVMGEDEAGRGGLTEASLKSGMLTCSYLHVPIVAMLRPRRLCPSAVEKRIEAVQNAAHLSSVRFARPCRCVLSHGTRTEAPSFSIRRAPISRLTEALVDPASRYLRLAAFLADSRLANDRPRRLNT